jgi:predicted MFS family arabinose efflux permease
MAGFGRLLRSNPNYRYMWTGQVVSEVGDHFNNIAVFSLALANTKSGLVVTGVMLARAVPVMIAGPIAGVLLDRMHRKHIMIASDIVRAIIALGFIASVDAASTELLYLLSGMLMFASPFFTSGRSAILPVIASKEELHTANALTQTTQWTTLSAGGMLAGLAVKQFGYEWAFLLNSFSFLVSAFCIWKLHLPGNQFTPQRAAVTESDMMRPFREYRDGLRYMRSVPLIFALAMINVGWATGGGAAQILFGLFGDIVFKMGSIGIGTIWGCGGLGLVLGGALAHRFGRRLEFDAYKRTIAICYVVHGASYVLFSQMQQFWAALVFIALSRAAIGVSSVLNTTQLLTHIKDEFRGRAFATIETLTWSVMMISMMAAGVASEHFSPRTIGACAGILSSLTAIYWLWANVTGRLPEPPRESDPLRVEVHREAAI